MIFNFLFLLMLVNVILIYILLMFKNFTDLNSYYCLESRNYSQIIFGLYGNNHPFSYYSLFFRYCQNTTENNNSCYSVEEIKK